ncbi:MAG: VCBS repeat-containing protein [Deltaproteobacteria bacterium]|nr:VCBS repeat-containing protein [Deltaproteobacteria bacterium]
MVNKCLEGGKILATGVRAVGSGKCRQLFLAALCLLAAALFSPVLVSPALAQDKIGIAPFTVFGPPELQYMKDALPQMLYSRLPYAAKEIVGKDAFREALKGLENKDELAQARKIMETTDYQYLVTGAYTKMGEAFSVDVKILKKGAADFKAIYVSMDKESKLFSAVEELSKQVAAIISGAEAKPQAAGVDAPVGKDLPAPVATKVGGAKAFQMLKAVGIHFPPTAGICLADIDGDGKKELVTGGNNTLYVYRIDDVRLTLLSTFLLKSYDILSLNCGDFDKNGQDEIYATALRADDAVTVVLAGTAGGQLQRQTEADWYVRAINHPVEGELLLGQKMGMDKAFDGDIYRLGYSKMAGLTAKSPFEFKAFLNLYQIQPIKYRGNNNRLAFFDEGDYLKIMDEKGKVVERLVERYGGSVRAIQKGLDSLMEKISFPLYQRIIRVEDGDTDAILVLKNEGSRLFSRYRNFERGQVAYLKFDETNYREAALSEMMDGYLSDVAVDKKNGKIYVTAVTENKEGKIFIYSNGQNAPGGGK